MSGLRSLRLAALLLVPGPSEAPPPPDAALRQAADALSNCQHALSNATGAPWIIEQTAATCQRLREGAGRSGVGPGVGKRSVDLAIALGPNGPEITLTLFRYDAGRAEPRAERRTVVEHHVDNGVLYFQTRDTLVLRPGQEAQLKESQWDFSIVGKDAAGSPCATASTWRSAPRARTCR